MSDEEFIASGGWAPTWVLVRRLRRKFEWERWYRPCPKCGMQLGRSKGSFDRVPLHVCGPGGRR